MTKNAKQNTISADLNLSVGGKPLTIHLEVEQGLTGPEAILPFARELADKTLAVAVAKAVSQGKSISCQKGCSACCAQLVPISEIEAREIARLINRLPKARRRIIISRFKAGREKLQQAGLWRQLANPRTLGKHDLTVFGMRYFDVQVFCPFLEGGACSIHEVRPIACREYLVISDPEYCANPHLEKIKGVQIPARVSKALGRIYADDPAFQTQWVPLILAPFWQDIHSEYPAKKAGPEWVELLLDKFS